LVELMVAVIIGLFVVGAVIALMLNMKRSFTDQDALAQLQDTQRLVAIVVSTSIAQAGYFPDPVNSSAVLSLPETTGSNPLAAGQALSGTEGGSGTSDTITSRYVAATGDGLVNCLGQANNSGASVLFSNRFTVNASNELLCSTDGGATTTVLVGNLASLRVLYGVDLLGNGTSLRYMSAGPVAAGALWERVQSVRVTAAFVNPFANQAGQPATVSWVQTVNLMNKS